MTWTGENVKIPGSTLKKNTKLKHNFLITCILGVRTLLSLTRQKSHCCLHTVIESFRQTFHERLISANDNDLDTFHFTQEKNMHYRTDILFMNTFLQQKLNILETCK